MRIKKYITESFNELIYKVSWPTWPELQNSAIVVMVATVVIALIISLMDLSFRNLMEFIYSVFY